ncbi:DUF2304 domain-containing protein [Nocardioides gansuensis]|uniref:DUF2304 domain-containing protein n=1 Tax=Nocardioides gansuensis TaxID=2138300 RepID=A0A2T8F6N5_9ACTN|nr:DUF2304 domain-containing protein [Nocardioides gansuensis]PVG81370.1 DUF2304 domain-containing protein [Nocardioides gansuensis]
MTSATVLGVLGALVVMVTLFEMLRRRRLREKYALLWFLIAVTALLAAVVPGLLLAITDLLGIALPLNLALFVGILVLFLMTLQHSSDLGRLEERSRTLAEEVAVLRLEVEQRRKEQQAERDAPAEDE